MMEEKQGGRERKEVRLGMKEGGREKRDGGEGREWEGGNERGSDGGVERGREWGASVEGWVGRREERRREGSDRGGEEARGVRRRG